VTPEHRAFEMQRVEELLGLDRGSEMEFRRQLGDVRRAAVAGAVGDDEPPIELRDRVVVRVEAIPPTAVQKDDRVPGKSGDASIATWEEASSVTAGRLPGTRLGPRM